VIMRLSPAEFRKAFPDEASCAAYLFERRWPAGFTCPVCDGKRYALLNSRAYTYECLDCGRQTSIVAGTVMHRTRLPLTLWFRAVHLIVSHPKTVSVVRFGTILGISYKTAWLLMQKLRPPIVTANSAPLEGIVEVGHTEIPVRGSGSHHSSGPATPTRMTIAAALDVTFYQVRVGEIPDESEESLEAFVRANVKPGATLRANPRLRLIDYSYDPEGWDPQTPETFGMLRNYHRRRRESLGVYLARFVVDHNDQNGRSEHVSFDTVLGLALHHEPMSYWDMLGHENPRKGTPTARRNPRYRKTATGMRQDGSGSTRP
jgi:hypothetical protein